MKKSCRKCAPTASPRPLLNFAIQAKTAICIQEILLKIRYFQRGLSKSLKKVYLFFRAQSLLMEKVNKNKRGLEPVTGCSSSYETSSKKFLHSLYIN